ncbi:MAG TPA: hypothetical protein VKJ67_04995 [Methylomirabilota bacterium]|nr:hypothetical protein [Methylomirabilota bacterium]
MLPVAALVYDGGRERRGDHAERAAVVGGPGSRREFYGRLAKADTGLALQAAQRAAMKEFPHPFAWAAFGLTGVGH